MNFDWQLAIRHNRDDLLRIVADLFVLVDPEAGTLPRHLRNYAHRIIRSAESALRRLIVIAARDVRVAVREVKPRKVKEGREAATRADDDNGMPRRSMATPSGTRNEVDVAITICPETPAAPQKAPPRTRLVPVDLGLANIRHLPETGPQPATPSIPAFPLIDPRKRFAVHRPRYARTHPRIISFGENPVPVYMRRPEPPDPKAPTPGDPVPAASLRRRLLALKAALDDLDRHARRLARHDARRRHRPRESRRITYAAMRPGRPPGWRGRDRYDIDEVLRECHRLALWSMKEGPP